MMDQQDKLEALIDHKMRKTILPYNEYVKAQSELTREVLVAVGKAAIRGDAAAAGLLFKVNVLTARPGRA